MKKHIIFTFLLLFCATISFAQTPSNKPGARQDTTYNHGSNVVFPEMTPQLVDNLELLGRIWGFLKYHHSFISKGDYNWDYELFRMLPGYLKVTYNKQRDAYLVKWITHFGKIPANKDVKPVDTNAVLKPDLSWINPDKLSPKLYKVLMNVYQNRNNGYYYVTYESPWLKVAKFIHENPYEDMEYPDVGYRLLTLYRYWNMVNYFFPYKQLTDTDWNTVLKQHIPSFISADEKKSYRRAIRRMIAQIDDTHGGVWFTKATQSLDYYRPPFKVSFLKNDTLVVSAYWDPDKIDSSGPHIGDVITHIDGKPVSYRVDSLAPYYAASNHRVKLRQLLWDICSGDKPTASISFVSDGIRKETTITRYNIEEMAPSFATDSICYKVLDDSIGYVSMDDITEAWVERIADTLHTTKGLILDLREYPNETINYKFYRILSDETRPFFKATVPDLSNPGEFVFSKPTYTGKGKQAYNGKIVILINENSQSHAEFCTMMYRTLPNSTVIGNTTAGADGNVVDIRLPGGVCSYFSGIGIYYPDGTETQRVGIIPDIYVWPTVQGIRDGRDELLEKALEWLAE
ncbi:MAG: peptidase S41 [Bacteroidales bacterium]|nr:peptidase S41 [Bacteroidales bacterium]